MTMIDILPDRLFAEPGRVVIRPFQVGPIPKSTQEAATSRMNRIVNSVLEMSEEACETELTLVDQDFTGRHWQTKRIYLDRFNQIREGLGLERGLSSTRQELIGAYFCHEYSYASAALMNPSIVAHPDQNGLAEGQLRLVMSLRAVGEGHISSVVFRECIIDSAGGFRLIPQSSLSVALQHAPQPSSIPGAVKIARFVETPLSGAVLFPMTDQQRNGIEDMRLVRFEQPDGRILYCGTYTAYNGRDIQSEILITEDFQNFELCPLQGGASRNKGMALFPRQIDGQYAMIGRQDGENIFYHTSPDLLRWESGQKLITPHYPWELVQMGNCGSPIEIDEGWLLLTHGVGAMRKYSIGAVLLDKKDPSKILGRSMTPLLAPHAEQREGYVPNVVYTCGAVALGRKLFVPYAVADSSVAFAWMDIDSMLSSLG